MMLLNCHVGKHSSESFGLQGDQTSQSNMYIIICKMIKPVKEISHDYSLEGLMLKLNLQYFSHLKQRAYSLEKTLMLGKIEGERRRGR